MRLRKQKRVVVGLMIAILAALPPSCGGEEVDETPPVIFDITVSNITESSATITWTTDEPVEGAVLTYHQKNTHTLLPPKYSDKSTFHIAVLEELRPDKHYWFQVSTADASGNTAISEKRSFRTTEVPLFDWAAWLERYRDPEFALQHGWLGYLDITWLDDPGDLCLDRGEEWCGTWLLHFVSHTSELTEMSLCVSRCDGLWDYPTYQAHNGPAEPIKFFPLWCHEPHGVIRMKAGETVPVRVTVRIPEDLPEEILLIMELGFLSARRRIPQVSHFEAIFDTSLWATVLCQDNCISIPSQLLPSSSTRMSRFCFVQCALSSEVLTQDFCHSY